MARRETAGQGDPSHEWSGLSAQALRFANRIIENDSRSRVVRMGERSLPPAKGAERSVKFTHVTTPTQDGTGITAEYELAVRTGSLSDDRSPALLYAVERRGSRDVITVDRRELYYHECVLQLEAEFGSYKGKDVISDAEKAREGELIAKANARIDADKAAGRDVLSAAQASALLNTLQKELGEQWELPEDPGKSDASSEPFVPAFQRIVGAHADEVRECHSQWVLGDTRSHLIVRDGPANPKPSVTLSVTDPQLGFQSWRFTPTQAIWNSQEGTTNDTDTNIMPKHGVTILEAAAAFFQDINMQTPREVSLEPDTNTFHDVVEQAQGIHNRDRNLQEHFISDEHDLSQAGARHSVTFMRSTSVSPDNHVQNQDTITISRELVSGGLPFPWIELSVGIDGDVSIEYPTLVDKLQRGEDISQYAEEMGPFMEGELGENIAAILANLQLNLVDGLPQDVDVRQYLDLGTIIPPEAFGGVIRDIVGASVFPAHQTIRTSTMSGPDSSVAVHTILDKNGNPDRVEVHEVSQRTIGGVRVGDEQLWLFSPTRPTEYFPMLIVLETFDTGDPRIEQAAAIQRTVKQDSVNRWIGDYSPATEDEKNLGIRTLGAVSEHFADNYRGETAIEELFHGPAVGEKGQQTFLGDVLGADDLLGAADDVPLTDREKKRKESKPEQPEKRKFNGK